MPMPMPSAPFSISAPTRIRFGDGVSADIADSLPAGTMRIVLIRGGASIAANDLSARLSDRGLIVQEVRCGTEPSVPSINAALEVLQPVTADAVIACGGGAVIDSAKAIRFCLDHGGRLTETFSDIPAPALAASGTIPLIAIPTTAGTGAEVTANAVLDLPSQHAKVSLRGRALVPDVALVDPRLLRSAPRSIVLASGLDSVVQTIEAYTSVAATPFSDALTRPNIAAGLLALRTVLDDATPDAWKTLAWVSLSSGLALANSGLGAAHGLASVLGAQYAMAHGALCGRFLVPVLRQNARRAPNGSDAATRIGLCRDSIANVFPPLPGGDALSGLEAWQTRAGLMRLGDRGVAADAIPALARQSATASSSRKNAVALAEADFEDILFAAL